MERQAIYIQFLNKVNKRFEDLGSQNAFTIEKMVNLLKNLS